MAKLNIVGVNGNIGSGKDTVADRFVEQGYTKVSLADPMKRFAQKVFGFSEEQLWGPSDNRNTWDERYFEGSDAWLLAAEACREYSEDWIKTLLPDATEDVIVDAEWDLQEWFGSLLETHPDLSPRVCLQLLGTEWGRQTLYENVWVDYMELVAEELFTVDEACYERQHGLMYTKAGIVQTSDGVVVPDVRFKNEFMFCKDNDYPIIKVRRPETDAKAAQTGITRHASETEQEDFDITLFDVVIENVGTLEDLLFMADTLADTYANKE